MRVVVSVAMSLDGFIDDSGPRRLVLSSPEDFDAVYRLRAESDVILVGGGTVRADDPSLATRRDEDFDLRRRRGAPPHPIKATITRTGDLPPDAKFFTEGNGQKLVFCGAHADSRLEGRLGSRATVVRLPGDEIRPGLIIQDLEVRGASQVMIEGGAGTIGLFLRAGAVDVVRLAIAPVTCGANGGVRLFDGSDMQWPDRRRMTLRKVEALGDTAVMWYELERVEVTTLDERDRELMELAFATSARSAPSASAFSVGAVLTDARRFVLTTGFSRETGLHEHAEEVAFAKAEAQGLETAGGFLYVTLEPCGTRKSKPRSCSAITLEKGISRVIYAASEPSVFVAEQNGLERLRRAGVEVLQMAGFEERFRRLHAHLLG